MEHGCYKIFYHWWLLVVETNEEINDRIYSEQSINGYLVFVLG